MPGKPLTKVEIGQIDAYRNCGKNISEIALIMGRNRKEIWCRGLQLERFVKYADSMPKRIQEVLKNKGGHTSY